MVNVRFSNYEQFLNFFKNAPRNVQNILYKAYPEFASRMTNDYMNSVKKISQGVENATNSISPKQLTMAKDTIKASGDIVNKASKLGKALNVLGNVGKVAGNVAGGIGAGFTILDPKTEWNQKALGAGLVIPQARIPSLVGLGVTSVAPKLINSYYDRKFDKDSRYNFQPGDIPNAYNLAPELKELTPGQREKYNQYVKDNLQTTYDLVDKTIAEGNEQINTPFGVSDPVPNSFNSNINVPVFNKGNSSIQSHTSQNAPQGGLNIPQDIQEVNLNQPALMGNVDALKIFGGDIPDYSRWNAGVSSRLSDLQDMVNQSNIQMQGVQSMQNSAGSDALLQYLQLQNAKNTQAQQQSADILKQYQDAINRDNTINTINTIANIASNVPEKAPVQWVTPWGIVTQQFDKQRSLNLPTNTSSNADAIVNQYKLQQATQGKQSDPTAQVLTAQALGDMYGVNPLVFLNKDLAQEYMKGQNTLANTKTTGQERRKDIPLSAQADVIKEDAKTAGDLAINQAQAYYNYILQDAREKHIDDRYAQMIASQEAQNYYNNQMRNYLQQQAQAYEYNYKLPFNRETQFGVADRYSQRRQSDSNPLDEMYKRAQIFNIGSGLQNPQQVQEFYNYIGGNNPINPYGTTVDQEAIIQNALRRK